MENKLSRLEVLTDFIEFGEKQMAKGSPYTAGWFNYDWYKDIEMLRKSLPIDIVERFDEKRERNRHRPGCECILCTG
jgi:hypothetical protein